MTTAERLLYLLRHAKSDWGEPARPDLDRPLAPRGRKAARAMARYLESSGVCPELVLCSPARRARETLEPVTEAWSVKPEVRFAAWLYGAPGSGLLAKLQELPPDTTSVMLVGHNPGLQDLATGLAGRGAKLGRLREKYPTGAMAVLGVPDWSRLEPGCAELVSFVAPRDLA